MGKWNVKLEIDLPSLARKTLDSKVVRAITPLFSERSFKQELGKRFIDEIVKRTESGIDKNGKSFKAYDADYRKSITFKIYKGNQRRVDLHLSGEMLASMDVTKITRTGLVLGFVSDDQEAKAHGHINGGGFNNSLPVRDFFGLPVEIQGKILAGTVRDFVDNQTNFEFVSENSEEIITDLL
jgi:hypothetical protein